jgi:predicted nucleotidyltransferase
MKFSDTQNEEVERYSAKTPFAARHICLAVGGSTLYGLNTDDSDLDLRGIFYLNEPKNILGLGLYGSFSEWENYVLRGDTDGVDATLYEIRKFFHLLNKTNTQVIEILYASESSFLIKSSEMDTLIRNKEKLINIDAMYNSLLGYIDGERRLMSGERTGRLGGKRVAALKKYGYSYKNLVQILRLAYCGEVLFTEGTYPVNIKEWDDSMFNQLMEIKTNPSQFNLNEANAAVDAAVVSLKTAYENRIVHFKFDMEWANKFLLTLYYRVLTDLRENKT